MRKELRQSIQRRARELLYSGARRRLMRSPVPMPNIGAALAASRAATRVRDGRFGVLAATSMGNHGRENIRRTREATSERHKPSALRRPLGDAAEIEAPLIGAMGQKPPCICAAKSRRETRCASELR